MYFDKYFKLSEFDSPDLKGSGSKMKKSTLTKLVETRKKSGIPFVITSGYRTKSHNKRVGGVNSSSHTRGYAVDIRCKTSKDRFKVIKYALECGFNRIGISGNFIHLDDDPTKTSNVIWVY